MAITSWRDDIRKRKTLTVFATDKVGGEWLRAFKDAIVEFNRVSRDLNLGVTFEIAATKPHPADDTGADVQFDTGKGKLRYEAMNEKFVAKNRQGEEIDFSPTALHGATQTLSLVFGNGPARMRRAFIFVPETPMVNVTVRASPKKDDFRQVQRQAGIGIRVYIAVHELVHACGLSNAEHNEMGENADVFTNFPDVAAGDFDKPQDDKFRLRNPDFALKRAAVLAPPIFLKTKVADMIRDNWK